MSLVEVPEVEGDGWVSELSCAPNKDITPITLVVGPFIHQTRPAGSDLVPTLQGESGLIQV